MRIVNASRQEGSERASERTGRQEGSRLVRSEDLSTERMFVTLVTLNYVLKGNTHTQRRAEQNEKEKKNKRVSGKESERASKRDVQRPRACVRRIEPLKA